MSCASKEPAPTVTELTIATFNVSMEADNYKARNDPRDPNALKKQLATGTHSQIKNVAAIIQHVRPDILLLNEFDYITDPKEGVEAFIANYLNRGQHGQQAIDYPFYYVAEVNTGVPSPYDLNGDGIASGTGDDAWGYGNYPGQYGMVLLSKYPLDEAKIRSFRLFKWHQMPNANRVMNPDGTAFHTDETWQGMRLSSKSHWDVPVSVNGKTLHVLAAHPTPPVFDGPEDRNGARNYDEIRLWADYISATSNDYLVDDAGNTGGLPEQAAFVIMGDLNASPNEGDTRQGAIDQLLLHPAVNAEPTPISKGGAQHTSDNPNAATHTSGFRLRVDYVLPSVKGLEVMSSGVFWPAEGDKMHFAVQERKTSSDHRLVWVKVALK
ncbi:endonuclease/exonuclease/phosphatase family protein [Echinimonas agarilytica]|uniref:Endonuclease/exonuclease/phosphatase family protein n=1 Tax=Echinimonas agarilytica TaxID=1215918 RepID=A0AA41W7E8_9GAMM|nr:endonuclease/exonuclease/phosphatase family protein [Echinimonas agarilytica]MCM2680592.1 endonuclease/exonuclease/phosphatase family protein [Echinimonas agarilytica]